MRYFALLPAVLALLTIFPVGQPHAQAVRQCEAGDTACRQNARRTNSGGVSAPRPASRALRQGSDGTLAPRTGRYRENGLYGSGQNKGCDSQAVRSRQRSGLVPNC